MVRNGDSVYLPGFANFIEHLGQQKPDLASKLDKLDRTYRQNKVPTWLLSVQRATQCSTKQPSAASISSLKPPPAISS